MKPNDEMWQALRETGWSNDDLLELQEFMRDDEPGSSADPDFERRLRLDLWWRLITRLHAPGSSPPHG